jgi:hypothetical protein
MYQAEKDSLDSFFSLEEIKIILETYLNMIVSDEIDASCSVDVYLIHRECLDILVGMVWVGVGLCGVVWFSSGFGVGF